jgi:endogenous inhibitor of DNA gyrase (YacG/DUF329 family)
MSAEFEVRQINCAECGARIVTLSPKRRFCSAKCRQRYLSRLQRKRIYADPAKKQASLERLFAWKAAHRKAKVEGAQA